MIARTSATVAPGGVLRALHSRPPLTVRRVRSAEADTCSLCMVGSAAGPLAGDDLQLRLVLEPGARARLRATGATLAQGGPGQPGSRVAHLVHLGAGAALDARPGPLVVCAGARTDVGLQIVLGPDATLIWREVVVLGRAGQPPTGAVRLRWDVTRDGGAPLLRQRLDLAGGTGAPDPGWRGLLRGRRVLSSCLVVQPGAGARTVVESATAVAQPLASDACLITVLADDAEQAEVSVDLLLTRLNEPGNGGPAR